ncbi:MAG: TIGR01906 family membrane protein, partial [Chloroflexi bacterium]|nr:TIGR01906 family membrane protein [Chloroflexota bacterium]
MLRRKEQERGSQRHTMTMKPLSYLVSLATPLALLGFALRVLLTPLYYTIEYNMPYFPADE